jgi:DNA-binding transcriptional LysR family regulator
MNREDMADLTAFVVVAQERNFTRAATKIGVTQSALSQIVRRLEERLGVRLLDRTTRSVAPTLAGERLVERMSPMLHDLDESLSEISALRETPAGIIRITSVEHAARKYIRPALSKLLKEHPELTVEIIVDYGLSDVVSERFDAGVRLGEHVAKDMIGLRISPEIKMAIVGSIDYLSKHSTPLEPRELVDHRCINLRLPTSETLNAWRLLENGIEIRVKSDGPYIFNSIELMLDAALDGTGLAYLPLDQVEPYLAKGLLKQVLIQQTPPLPPYYLYYPNRRHSSPAFKLILDSLRHQLRHFED